MREGLARLHHVEIDVRRQAKGPEVLTQQLAVLAGRDQANLETARGAAEGQDDRSQLDGLGASADDDGDAPDFHRGLAIQRATAHETRVTK